MNQGHGRQISQPIHTRRLTCLLFIRVVELPFPKRVVTICSVFVFRPSGFRHERCGDGRLLGLGLHNPHIRIFLSTIPCNTSPVGTSLIQDSYTPSINPLFTKGTDRRVNAAAPPPAFSWGASSSVPKVLGLESVGNRRIQHWWVHMQTYLPSSPHESRFVVSQREHCLFPMYGRALPPLLRTHQMHVCGNATRCASEQP